MLKQLLVFLGVAIVTVPLFKRLGLGSVLGYLIAGLLIGPHALGLIGNVDDVLHTAEFGVVLLLFLVGLELDPARLWRMRSSVFGVGGVQVGATTAVLFAPLYFFGLPVAAALVAAIALSLSSTAIALQLFTERNELTKPAGRAGFGILLFQDLAALPVLAAIPLLATGAAAKGTAERGVWGYFIPFAVLGTVAAARFVTRPLLNFIARTKIQELFTATALFTVVGAAALAELAGLSMALGAFLAGVLLADSEYRHELEADIEPFKGLLLGLFFIAVGMSLNVPLVSARPGAVLGAAFGVMALKALVLVGIGLWRPGGREHAATMAVMLSQVGEFAFVLFGQARTLSVMTEEQTDFLVAVTGISMAMSPLLVAAYEKWIRARLRKAEHKPYDVSVDEDAPVIIAGFGRVGQVVARVLTAKRIGFTALDKSSEHIEFLKKFGNKVFFGDASRLELLRAARADKAKIFVLAIDDPDSSIRTAETVLKHFPELTIFARARNRQHAYRLLELGITRIMRETWAGSLNMTRDVLVQLGDTEEDARRSIERFDVFDEEMLRTSYKHSKDLTKLMEIASQARLELEQIFENDRASQKKTGA